MLADQVSERLNCISTVFMLLLCGIIIHAAAVD